MIKNLKKPSSTTFRLSKKKRTGRKYYYRARSFRTVNGKNYYSGNSRAVRF